jgi:hypothetical protein
MKKESRKAKIELVNFDSSKETVASSGGRHIYFTVTKEAKVDKFEFFISLLTTIENPVSLTDERLVKLAVANIEQYVDQIGIKGDGSHFFGLTGTNFIPKENIEWFPPPE